MITVQQAYDLAVMLMDEQEDSNGATDSSELSGYRNRTLALVNILSSDLYNLSDNTAFPANVKPAPPLVTAFSDAVPLDDRLAVNVLPYGLAGLFKKGEDIQMSAYFLNLYHSLRAEYAQKKPAKKVPVTNVYGSFSGSVRGEISADD